MRWDARAPSRICPARAGHLDLLCCVPRGEVSLWGPEGRICLDDFSEKSSLGDRTKFRSTLNFGQRRRQVLVEAPERVTPRVW